MSTMEIVGSYGSLTVHASTGLIVGRNSEPEYDDILWFDPRYLPDSDEADILDTAFVTDEGIYVRELSYDPVHGEFVDCLFLEGPK